MRIHKEGGASDKPTMSKPQPEVLLTVPVFTEAKQIVVLHDPLPELKGPAFNRLSRLRTLQKPRHHESILSFTSPSLFHQQALRNFLSTIDGIFSLKINDSKIQLTQDDSKLKAAYEECHKLWQEENKLLGEVELLKSLVEDQPDLAKIFKESLPVHGLTGYGSHFRTPIAVALAHDYALTTGNPMSIVFGDIANAGGTNDLYYNLIDDSQISELYSKLDIEAVEGESLVEKKEKIAQKLTDWSVRIITGILREKLEAAFPDKKDQFQFLGVGGDEFYITGPASTDEIEKVIREQVLPEINKAMNELGLDSHPHRKKQLGKEPGLGVSFGGVSSLNQKRIKLQEISQKGSDMKTQHSLDDQVKPELNNILETLQSERYARFKPETMDSAALQQMLMLKDSSQFFNSIDDLIRHQLFTMLNDSTGVQDIRALPSFVKAMKLKPGEFFLIPLACKNLSAINDNADHDRGDKLIRDFAARVRTNIKTGNEQSEIFSAGAGKFVCVIPANAFDAHDAFVASLIQIETDFNAEEVSETDKRKIGSLENSQNKEQGIKVISGFRKYAPSANGKLTPLEVVINRLVREIK